MDAFKSYKYGLGNWIAWKCQDGSNFVIFYGDAEYKIKGPNNWISYVS